ncbi:MAG: LysR family transcriptional regulator, partial [Paludibacter sp.]
MTLQQLEYILALDKTRHFVRAAEMCGVTQPTLSAMIQKLEDELDCKIFDRSTHPIVPTQVGETIIRKAMTVIQNVNHLKESINSIKGDVSGNLSLAIIPTVAPYLLPGIISEFKNTYKDVNLRLSEMRTSTIIDKLATGELDMAILATPLDNNELLEVPLYYEKFVAYISPNEPLYQ